MSYDEDEDWTLVDFTDERRGPGYAQARPAPSNVGPSFVSKARPPVSGKACPRCGKPLGRGAHFHVKHCKG